MTEEDLQQVLLQHEPTVVHFSGHGTPVGILFVDDCNRAKPILSATLVSVFRALKDSIQLVVLNACSSHAHAQALVEHIDCAISIPGDIEESAAISFAASFYQALGFGKSVQTALELGIAAITSKGAECEWPVVAVKNGLDRHAITLVPT